MCTKLSQLVIYSWKYLLVWVTWKLLLNLEVNYKGWCPLSNTFADNLKELKNFKDFMWKYQLFIWVMWRISAFWDLFLPLFAETFSWKRVVPSGIPPSKRDSHTCSSWKNKIIVIGGEDSCDYYLSDVHILDTGMIKLFLLYFSLYSHHSSLWNYVHYLNCVLTWFILSFLSN